MLNKSLKPQKAFSLTELIIVIIIIGLVVAIGLPGINKARADAETEAMRAKAVAIQNAKMAFITAVGHDTAQTQWGAANDETRYENLLRQYLPANYSATLNTAADSLFPNGGAFSVILDGNGTATATGVIDNTVTLMGPDPSTGAAGHIFPLQKY